MSIFTPFYIFFQVREVTIHGIRVFESLKVTDGMSTPRRLSKSYEWFVGHALVINEPSLTLSK